MPDIDLTVRDCVLPSGLWDTSKWQSILPSHIATLITQCKPPQGEETDVLAWRPAKDGIFSVKSAYDFANDVGRTRPTATIWNRVWKWQILETLKYFMWQISHECVMTNSTRTKRGLSGSEGCPFACQ